MNYDEALAYIHSLPRFAPAPGLDRMQRFLGMLGDPQRAPAYVHIGGTNGKGSATAMVASMLRCAGYRTGTYTSPHLERFEERIVVDGEPISPQAVADLASRLRPAAGRLAAQSDHGLIEFEMTTAMAFEHFRSAGCEVVALEVGLGGRFDATNVIDPPLAAVITSIGHDHVEVLGGTLELIAREKAGIVKPGAPTVTAARDPVVLAAIGTAVRERGGAGLWTVGPGWQAASHAPQTPHAEHAPQTPHGPGPADGHVRWHRTAFGVDGQTFDLQLDLPTGRAAYGGLTIGLLGRHQIDNAACAVAAMHALPARGLGPVGEAAIRRGLAEARWPGRFEILARRPWLILDGAHNPPGALALRDTFEELFPGAMGRATLVLGVLGDKAADAVVAALAPLAARVIVTRPNNPARALEPSALAAAVRAADPRLDVEVREPAAAALESGIQALQDPDDVLVVTGSLYLTGEARSYLRRRVRVGLV
ncbi:MAG: folylpolyglutamate synthase/dihydrofolate synthase family protein [Bacillota bacterium]|nr:folylpolyglutamate synthase/dihydrofolate synthase family protein [Bacillota bacterium]